MLAERNEGLEFHAVFTDAVMFYFAVMNPKKSCVHKLSSLACYIFIYLNMYVNKYYVLNIKKKTMLFTTYYYLFTLLGGLI